MFVLFRNHSVAFASSKQNRKYPQPIGEGHLVSDTFDTGLPLPSHGIGSEQYALAKAAAQEHSLVSLPSSLWRMASRVHAVYSSITRSAYHFTRGEPSFGDLKIATGAYRSVWNSGFTCIQIAAICLSINGVLVKLLARVGVFQILFARSAPCLVATCILSKLTGIKHVLGEPKCMALLSVRGMLGATMITALYLGFMRIPLGDAFALCATSPTIAALLGLALRLERASWQMALGTLSSTAGALLVAHPPLIFGGHESWGHARVMGIAFLELAAICSAGGYLLDGKLSTSVPSLTIIAWFHLAGVVASVVPMSMGYPKPLVLRLGLREWGCALGIFALSMCGQLLLVRGAQLCGGSKTASLNTVQIVYSHFWGYSLLGERTTLVGAAGAVLVGVGTLAVAYGKDARMQKGATEVLWEDVEAGGGDKLSVNGSKTNEILTA
eukprot:evm.model.scf_1429.5 EVM.evm.TU.scf_1429.5   scf_1429:23028-24347(+)